MNKNYTPDSKQMILSPSGIYPKQSSGMGSTSSLVHILSRPFGSLLLAFLGMFFIAGKTNANDIYLAQNASGSGSGADWANAAKGDTYMASLAFLNNISDDTHFYLKTGIYTVNNTAYTRLGKNNTIQGGFPDSAIGTDKSGYNPINNPTTINVHGTTFLTASTSGSDPISTIELKGIRFIGTGGGGAGIFNGSGSGGSGLSPGLFKATDLYVSQFKAGGSTFVLSNANAAVGHSLFANSVFYDNSSALGGGVIYANNSSGAAPITVTGCSFIKNAATPGNPTGGGAIATFSDGTIINSYFCENTADAGGALANAASGGPAVNWNITGSTFYKNKATGQHGGALAANPGAIHINSTNFYENTAAGGGGAIFKGPNGSSDLTNNITNCIFYKNGTLENRDGYGGGAIDFYLTNYADTPISQCKFVENYSTFTPGGAIYTLNNNNTGGYKIGLDQCLFYGNKYQGSTTNLGADFVAAYAGSNFTKFVVSNTKVQLNAATSPPYIALANNPSNYPWPYDFSGGGNTAGNNALTGDNGGVTSFTGTCPSNINPICLSSDDPAPSFATTSLTTSCPATSLTLPTTATNQNPDVTLTWHSATPATPANQLSTNLVSTSGTYYAAFYDPARQCYSPSTTPVRVTITTCPDLTPIIYARPSTVHDISPITVVVDVVELKGVTTNGLLTVRVSKDAHVSLSFPGGATLLGGRAVQNGLWSFDGSSDPTYYVLTTSQPVSGSGMLSFGLAGSLVPGGTNGNLTLSVVIEPNSGGEVRVNNNTDAETIDYFQL